MTTDLFMDNTFVLFLLFVLSVFMIEKLNERQKIAICYICSYALSFGNLISKKMIVLFLIFMLFLMQEYFTSDYKKLKILKKIQYKFVDFLYMGVFQYKLWLVIISICLKSLTLKNMVGFLDYIIDLVSLIIFGCAIHWMFNVTEDFYSFTEMYDNIWMTPYYNVKFDDELRERLDIIVSFEDRLYWKRAGTYSIASIEFIKVWYRDRFLQKENKQLTRISFIDNIFMVIREIKICIYKLKKVFTYVFHFFTRGHSTIPMQIIRILSYRHGLVFGNTKIGFKYYKIFKRKLYEILYSRMFFEGLKDYLKVELCNDMEHYREYLVYLYPHIVQTTIEGKTYAPAKKAFEVEENGNKYIPIINEWDFEKVIDMCFGFNGLSITEKRMNEKRAIIEKYGLSKET